MFKVCGLHSVTVHCCNGKTKHKLRFEFFCLFFFCNCFVSLLHCRSLGLRGAMLGLMLLVFIVAKNVWVLHVETNKINVTRRISAEKNQAIWPRVAEIRLYTMQCVGVPQGRGLFVSSESVITVKGLVQVSIPSCKFVSSDVYQAALVVKRVRWWSLGTISNTNYVLEHQGSSAHDQVAQTLN